MSEIQGKAMEMVAAHGAMVAALQARQEELDAYVAQHLEATAALRQQHQATLSALAAEYVALGADPVALHPWVAKEIQL